MELRIYGTLIHGTTDWGDFWEEEKGWALGTEATPLAFCLGGGDSAWVRRQGRCLGLGDGAGA